MKQIILIVVSYLCFVECLDKNNGEVEGRGKGKYALLIHFFYVVATKLFVLKIVYGIIFYVIVTKAWHFAIWFTHYLKEKKHDHHEYIEHDHGHYDHDHYDHEYSGYEPYAYQKHGYKGFDPVGSYSNPIRIQGPYSGQNNYQKGVYDSDGSYSVKS